MGRCPRSRDDRAEAIVLGCAGRAYRRTLRAALGVPVIDGVAGGVKFAERLLVSGLSSSRIGAFGVPPWKGLTGRFTGMGQARAARIAARSASRSAASSGSAP